jgi:hypothetical protein
MLTWLLICAAALVGMVAVVRVTLRDLDAADRRIRREFREATGRGMPL